MSTQALVRFDYNKPPKDGLSGLQRLAYPIKAQISAALPSFMATNTERVIRCMYTECQRLPALLDCTPKSLFGSLIQCAQLGLELGGPLGQAYIVPMGKGVKKAQLWIGYKGFLTLALRCQHLRRITPRYVLEGDDFSIEFGDDQHLHHKPHPDFKGKIIGYYTSIETVNGGKDFEYMTIAMAEAHRTKYASDRRVGDAVWWTHFDEMALKTTMRRMGKRTPLSVDWSSAAAVDELAEQGIDQGLEHLVLADSVEGPSEPGHVDESEGSSSPEGELRKKLNEAKSGRRAQAGTDLPPD